ncbi:hypothetical protein ACFORG_07315 [Lutimaribacter marinistellae]|uniref:Uncharacterized protein n=1 Tax=Lutimaribacter marinistellae TaxID=1820329 RepID=A0ABV7TE61_9RHOB
MKAPIRKPAKPEGKATRSPWDDPDFRIYGFNASWWPLLRLVNDGRTKEQE